MGHHGEIVVRSDAAPDVEAERDTFDWVPWEGADPVRLQVPRWMGSGSGMRFSWQIRRADEMSQRAEAKRKRALTDEGRAEADQLAMEAGLMAQAGAYDLLLAVLGEDQIHTVIAVADREGVDDAGLIGLCGEVMSLIGKRPTQPSTASADGRLQSGSGSTDGGSGAEPVSTPRGRTTTASGRRSKPKKQPGRVVQGEVVQMTPREQQRLQEQAQVAPADEALATYST